MSDLEQITNIENTHNIAALYQEMMQDKFNSSIPRNLQMTLALRPDITTGVSTLTNAIVLEGQLPDMVKQMIMVTISAQNNCQFCASFHTELLESLGAPSEVIQNCVADPTFSNVPSSYREILRFALKAAQEPTALTEADFELLRDNGLSDEEIIEIGMLAAFTKFLNTWTEITDLPLDDEA